MSVYGIGADLVRTDRIARMRRAYGERFLDRVFSPKEKAQAMVRRDPDAHLAARFAAKEALAKAMGTGIFAERLSDICVEKDAQGRPGIALSGGWARRCTLAGVTGLHLTISHEGSYALAVVVCEGGQQP